MTAKQLRLFDMVPVPAPGMSARELLRLDQPDDPLPARTPRVPGRAVWSPAAVPDGSNTYVNEETGEVIRVGPSARRAARVEARRDGHVAREAGERARFREAGRRGVAAAREVLPRHAPIGLERPAGYAQGRRN